MRFKQSAIRLILILEPVCEFLITDVKSGYKNYVINKFTKTLAYVSMNFLTTLNSENCFTRQDYFFKEFIHNISNVNIEDLFLVIQMF